MFDFGSALNLDWLLKHFFEMINIKKLNLPMDFAFALWMWIVILGLRVGYR